MKQLLLLLVMLICFYNAEAKQLFPDSDTAKSNIELGVEGIQRLCPTGMWDHWTFRDIIFDRESNTVLLVIQLYNWEQENDEKAKNISESDALHQAEWIVSCFKEAYGDLIENPLIEYDGDFMLYLSLGTLFKEMEKDNVNLRIMLLKPDYANQVLGNIPLEFSSRQLKDIKPKE